MTLDSLSDDRRQVIARLLRTRRARLQPEAVGIVRGARRRTPGLRREEVAALANVSTEWYKWLEQAREVRASAGALRRIAEALRLEPGETDHLLRLSGYGLEQGDPLGPKEPAVSSHLQVLLDELDPCPAWVVGARWDYVAWNRAATVISGDLDKVALRDRNTLCQLFVGDRLRRILVDWDRHAKGVVGTVRAQCAGMPDDPWVDQLVGRVRAASREFDAWWDDPEIRGYEDGEKHYRHPDLGALAFTYTKLGLADQRYRTLSLRVYVPLAGTETRAKMNAALADQGRGPRKPVPREPGLDGRPMG